MLLFFLMLSRTPSFTRTDTLLPYPTLFRSTAAHGQGPSGSSAEMRKCESRRGGACIPPAGATAVIAGASVVEADLVDQHAGLAAVEYHFGQRQRDDLQFTKAPDHRVEYNLGTHGASEAGASVQAMRVYHDQTTTRAT